MNDLISRREAIEAIRKIYDSVGILGEKWAVDKCQMAIKDLPSAQPEIIRCKDCAKHNKRIGDYEELSVGEKRMILKEDACPLIEFRGKAQGHEYDYQFCVYAKRRDDEWF